MTPDKLLRDLSLIRLPSMDRIKINALLITDRMHRKAAQIPLSRRRRSRQIDSDRIFTGHPSRSTFVYHHNGPSYPPGIRMNPEIMLQILQILRAECVIAPFLMTSAAILLRCKIPINLDGKYNTQLKLITEEKPENFPSRSSTQKRQLFSPNLQETCCCIL
jgi:hypothetical protein